MGRRDVRDDRGSSTVLALGVIAVMLSLMVAGLAVLSAVHAAHVARSSADLAALAGAIEYQERSTRGAACAEARRIARGHGARLVSCGVAGRGVVTVTTSVPIAHRLVGVGPTHAEGRARAGPTEDVRRRSRE